MAQAGSLVLENHGQRPAKAGNPHSAHAAGSNFTEHPDRPRGTESSKHCPSPGHGRSGHSVVKKVAHIRPATSPLAPDRQGQLNRVRIKCPTTRLIPEGMDFASTRPPSAPTTTAPRCTPQSSAPACNQRDSCWCQRFKQGPDWLPVKSAAIAGRPRVELPPVPPMTHHW